MNGKQLGLGVLLVAFVGLEVYAIEQHGVVGLFEACLANAATTVAFVDLVIALGMVSLWVIFDARDHGVSPLPYVVLTLTLGSVGPLLYLIRRERVPVRRPVGAMAR